MNHTVTSDVSDTPTEHRAWYQWFPLILVLQAILFYMPCFLWRITEGGKLSMAVSSRLEKKKHKNVLEKVKRLGKPTIKVTQGEYNSWSLSMESGGKSKDEQEEHNEERKELVDMIVQYMKKEHEDHDSYFIYFCLFEFLNLLNVFVQWLAMIFCFGSDMLCPMCKPDEGLPYIVLPKVILCVIEGTALKGKCVMPMNFLIKYVYIGLFYWFFVLMSFSYMMFMIRLIQVSSNNVRLLMLRRHLGVKSGVLEKVLNKKNKNKRGDWYILYKLGQLIDSDAFKDIIDKLAEDADELPSSATESTSTGGVEWR